MSGKQKTEGVRRIWDKYKFVALVALAGAVLLLWPGGDGKTAERASPQAAALVGAVGTALGAMAGNLTVGRKKYAAVEEDIRAAVKRAEALQKRLLELVEEDAAGFTPLSRAYAIPKDDPSRGRVLEDATAAACRAPAEMMALCCASIELLEELLEKGSAGLVSDVGCGALCCAAALESASLNIFVNTQTLQDRSMAAHLDAQADTLLCEYLPRARRVADEVGHRLRKEG